MIDEPLSYTIIPPKGRPVIVQVEFDGNPFAHHDHEWTWRTVRLVIRTESALLRAGESMGPMLPWAVGDQVAIESDPMRIKTCTCGDWRTS